MNTQLIDLSADEMLTVGGGDGDALTCYLLGAGFAVGVLSGPAGWVAALIAADKARTSGCLD